jgi:hypothetical protein
MHDDCTPAERRKRREARSSERRAQALALRRRGKTFAAIGRELGVCPARARQIIVKAERLAVHPHWADALPARSRLFLINAGFARLPELEAGQAIARLSRREALAFPNFGIGALTALIAWLEKHGLALRQGDGRDVRGQAKARRDGIPTGLMKKGIRYARSKYDDIARDASG